MSGTWYRLSICKLVLQICLNGNGQPHKLTLPLQRIKPFSWDAYLYKEQSNSGSAELRQMQVLHLVSAPRSLLDLSPPEKARAPGE